MDRRKYLTCLAGGVSLSGCLTDSERHATTGSAKVKRRYTFVSSKSFITGQPALSSSIGSMYGAVATTTEEAESVFNWQRWNHPDHSEPYRNLQAGEEYLCVLVAVVHPGEVLKTDTSAVEEGTVIYTAEIERKDESPDPDLPDPIFSYALDKWILDGVELPSDVTITTA